MNPGRKLYSWSKSQLIKNLKKVVYLTLTKVQLWKSNLLSVDNIARLIVKSSWGCCNRLCRVYDVAQHGILIKRQSGLKTCW